MSYTELERLTIAAEAIARCAHSRQARTDGRPYITHPEAVAAAVEPRLKPIAWLHDVMEDSHIDLLALADADFPDYVLNALDALTRPEYMDYQHYIENFVVGKPDAVAVKIADIRHNLSDAPTDRQVKKYSQALLALEREI